MARTFAVLAAALAVMAGTPAGHAEGVLSELQVCRGLKDAERLACFDRVLARHDSTAAQPATAAPPSAPAAPPPVAVAKPGSEFGAERLQQDEAAAKQNESMVAGVAGVRFNAFKQFTVTLDNGQVWRQLESDTATARFGAAASVKISRGFLDSYSLSIEGVWGTYKVKRIK